MDFSELARDQTADQLQELATTFARVAIHYYWALNKGGLPSELQQVLTEQFNEAYLRRVVLGEYDKGA